MNMMDELARTYAVKGLIDEEQMANEEATIFYK